MRKYRNLGIKHKVSYGKQNLNVLMSLEFTIDNAMVHLLQRKGLDVSHVVVLGKT